MLSVRFECLNYLPIYRSVTDDEFTKKIIEL